MILHHYGSDEACMCHAWKNVRGHAGNYQALRWGQLSTGHQPESSFSYCVL